MISFVFHLCSLNNINSSTGRNLTDVCPNGLTENTEDLLCKVCCCSHGMYLYVSIKYD